MTEDRVRAEHLGAVNVPAHWAYFASVILGGTALMLLLIAVMGAANGG
ncbi:MAG TPA: hypothetical protein VM344_06445 [Vitreimonas sp.]|nr:hypothetical protein [Vitreimonas sp.]